MCCPVIADSGCGCSLELCCKIQGYHSAVWSAQKAVFLAVLLGDRLVAGGPVYSWAAAMGTPFLATGIALNVLATAASGAFLVGVYQKRPRLISPYLVVLLLQLIMHVTAVLLVGDDSVHFVAVGLFESFLFLYLLRAAGSYRFELREAQSPTKLNSSYASTDVTVLAAGEQPAPCDEIQLVNFPKSTVLLTDNKGWNVIQTPQ